MQLKSDKTKIMFPEIKTERLILREFKQDDRVNVFDGLSDPKVIEFYGVNYSTLEDTQIQMDWFAEIYKSNTGIWWAISNNKTGDFMGGVGFNNLDEANKKVELGFWLLPKFWGHGFMQEAGAATVNYGFVNLKLNRIEAFVETENKNSSRLLNKLKFTKEGSMIECEIKNDKYISLEIYALLASKFIA